MRQDARILLDRLRQTDLTYREFDVPNGPEPAEKWPLFAALNALSPAPAPRAPVPAPTPVQTLTAAPPTRPQAVPSAEQPFLRRYDAASAPSVAPDTLQDVFRHISRRD